MGMTVKRTKNKRVFSYSGDLDKAIEGAKKELEKKVSSQERVFLLWQYQKAQKAHETYERRIRDLESFIDLAEEELKKQREGAAE